MYEIEYYESSPGNYPIAKYIEELTGKHKQKELVTLFYYIDMLKLHGPNINSSFKSNAVKPIDKQIFELRPSTTRVFFFFLCGKKIVLLHAYEKKTRRTDHNQIKTAIREKNDYLRLKGIKS